MKQAFLKDDAFLADVAAAPRNAHTLNVWWMGGSGFLIGWNNKHVLMDPYLSESLSMKYHGTDMPHVRVTERVVDPARLGFIDVVTASHSHTDHYDGDTLLALKSANPAMEMVLPWSLLGQTVYKLTHDAAMLHGLDAGQEAHIHGMTFHAVPAAHEVVEKDRQGHDLYLGYVVTLGPFKVYHSGDTVHFEGIEAQLVPHAVDLALLPINGRKPRIQGNFNAPEAAGVARGIAAKLAVPCHYDLFEFNTADPAEFEEACAAIGQPCHVLRNGERLTLRAE